ncbi:hypothetical protein D3C75_706370 [compost metagenome]
MQHTVYRISNRDVTAIQRVTFRFQRFNVTFHFRRFAEQHIQRHINWLVVEMAIVKRQMFFFRRFTNHGIWRSFTAAQFVKQRQLVWGNGQNITFLGFVTPHFQRAHARLIVQDIAQFKTTTTAAVTHQLRHGVGKATRAYIVNKQDWVGIAQFPAAVDDFLATAFHFWVITLYGSKIQIRIRLA